MSERHGITHDAAPGHEPAPMSVGTYLQTAREDAGLTLDEVAQQLKLAPRQVQAIENDDFAGLPGRTFVRGFVRNYARLLNLDVDSLLAGLPGGSTPSLDSPALHATAPTMGELPASERGRSNWTRWAIPLTLVALIALAAWYEFARVHNSSAFPGLHNEAVDVAAERAAAPGNPSITTATNAPGANPAAPVPSTTAPAQPASPEQSLHNPLTAKEGTPASAANAPAAASPAAANGPVTEATLVLRFHDKSWTTVKDRDGQVLLGQLVAPGQTQTFSGVPPFDLVIGNAMEVSLTYRGEPIDLAPFIRGGVARLTLR